MTTKARIQDGIIKEILAVDPFPPFHPAITWVDCGPEVLEGDLYDGTTFKHPQVISTPTPKPLDPVTKLQAFLSDNPDVLNLIT